MFIAHHRGPRPDGEDEPRPRRARDEDDFEAEPAPAPRRNPPARQGPSYLVIAGLTVGILVAVGGALLLLLREANKPAAPPGVKVVQAVKQAEEPPPPGKNGVGGEEEQAAAEQVTLSNPRWGEEPGPRGRTLQVDYAFAEGWQPARVCVLRWKYADGGTGLANLRSKLEPRGTLTIVVPVGADKKDPKERGALEIWVQEAGTKVSNSVTLNAPPA